MATPSSTVDPQQTIAIRARARAWETLTGVGRARLHLSLNSPIALDFWRRRLNAVMHVAMHPPHLAQFRCIHRYEGSWSDSGDPYWGGLQMDREFMSGYAPGYLLRRGLANVWTPLEQIWVAERAYRSGRGFYAWPNTARYCGLI